MKKLRYCASIASFIIIFSVFVLLAVRREPQIIISQNGRILNYTLTNVARIGIGITSSQSGPVLGLHWRVGSNVLSGTTVAGFSGFEVLPAGDAESGQIQIPANASQVEVYCRYRWHLGIEEYADEIEEKTGFSFFRYPIEFARSENTVEKNIIIKD